MFMMLAAFLFKENAAYSDDLLQAAVERAAAVDHILNIVPKAMRIFIVNRESIHPTARCRRGEARIAEPNFRKQWPEPQSSKRPKMKCLSDSDPAQNGGRNYCTVHLEEAKILAGSVARKRCKPPFCSNL
jgi:hypothetical protein